MNTVQFGKTYIYSGTYGKSRMFSSVCSNSNWCYGYNSIGIYYRRHIGTFKPIECMNGIK